MSASFLLGLRNASLLCPRALLALSGARTALALFFSSLGSAAALLCPRATFARDSALFALHPLFPWAPQRFAAFAPRATFAVQRSLRTSPAALKRLLFLTGKWPRTRARPACLGSRVARLAAMRAAINPPNQRRILNYPICG